MIRTTQEEAWRLISSLVPVNAGPLIGYALHQLPPSCIPTGSLDPEDAQLIQNNLYRRPTEPILDNSIAYVVASRGTPVAWLTYRAQVVLPKAELSAYQSRHQALAAEALRSLHRSELLILARLRDEREGRTNPAPPAGRRAATAVLVAHRQDPTLTVWARIDKELDRSVRHLAALLGRPDAAQDELLILDAMGYGDYGRDRTVLSLDALCAIEAITAAFALPAYVAGDWLRAVASTATPASWRSPRPSPTPTSARMTARAPSSRPNETGAAGPTRCQRPAFR
ncbi:hypothetical protein [Actinoplanes sp. NPDC051859]|uniref:hypothetical protein n=1 Tax=Actinoplanes sp. NPDC051859 TaxID=3363909 RepID=UPI0037947996